MTFKEWAVAKGWTKQHPGWRWAQEAWEAGQGALAMDRRADAPRPPLAAREWIGAVDLSEDIEAAEAVDEIHKGDAVGWVGPGQVQSLKHPPLKEGPHPRKSARKKK